ATPPHRRNPRCPIFTDDTIDCAAIFAAVPSTSSLLPRISASCSYAPARLTVLSAGQPRSSTDAVAPWTAARLTRRGQRRASIQAASDGERSAALVYFAFDLLFLSEPRFPGSPSSTNRRFQAPAHLAPRSLSSCRNAMRTARRPCNPLARSA